MTFLGGKNMTIKKAIIKGLLCTLLTTPLVNGVGVLNEEEEPVIIDEVVEVAEENELAEVEEITLAEEEIAQEETIKEEIIVEESVTVEEEALLNSGEDNLAEEVSIVETEEENIIEQVVEVWTIVRVEHVYVNTISGSGEYYTIYGRSDNELLECIADDYSAEYVNQNLWLTEVGSQVLHIYNSDEEWCTGELYPIN